MKVNIYTSFNGVGLEKDYQLLKAIFEQDGHRTEVADWKRRHVRPQAGDVAIHLEIPRYDLMPLCRKNILVPNPEWFDERWVFSMRKFDAIWCKTLDCMRIFKDLHRNAVFGGFTSVDFSQKTGKGKQLLHVQGASDMKGTHEIMQAYAENDLPKLFLLSKKVETAAGNVTCGGFIDSDTFSKLLNACLIHLCPSYYEGFGHYIWEAMSCGAVVITTDSAPMNEFITDKRFLVKAVKPYRHHYGLLHRPDVADLVQKIKSVYAMNESELIEIGQQNREKFLQNDAQFRKNVLSLL